MKNISSAHVSATLLERLTFRWKPLYIQWWLSGPWEAVTGNSYPADMFLFIIATIRLHKPWEPWRSSHEQQVWFYFWLFLSFPVCWLLVKSSVNKSAHPIRDHSFSTYAKFSEKTNVSYPLIRTRTCAYQGVRNVSFSENFAYVLNEWSLIFVANT